jgi:uncharacterized protein (TIGR00106 family)
MALMQLTVIPLGTSSPSVGEFVAAIQKSLEKEGVSFTLTDMGTIIEGEAGKLLTLAARLHEQSFAGGIERVVTQINLDDRRDKQVHLGDKVAAVRKRAASEPG